MKWKIMDIKDIIPQNQNNIRFAPEEQYLGRIRATKKTPRSSGAQSKKMDMESPNDFAPTERFSPFIATSTKIIILWSRFG